MTLAVNDRYRLNLEALEALQPDVASTVDAAVIPAGVTPATGRDGLETLQVLEGNGRRQWFGKSSMPRVSSEEMLCNVQRDGGNVLLPGVLTGAEPLAAAKRLAQHSAVFVVERDPLSVKLAMHVRDYTDLLEAGRVVFLVGEDLESSLRQFFHEHPGYEMPAHLFTVPQRTPAQISDLQRRLEAGGEGVLAVQAQVTDLRARAVRKRFDDGEVLTMLPPKPRVALLSSDVRPEAHEHAARIVRALERLQWEYVSCVPDRPDRCHVSARLEAIERVEADFVLFVNSHAHAVRALLPAALPIASWYFPGTGVAGVLGENLGPFDMFFASSPDLQASLVAAGAPPDTVERCDIAADELSYHPIPSPKFTGAKTGGEVVILVDLPDDRPESAGVTLPSHTALWTALRDLVRSEADGYRAQVASELFDRAQRLSGTMINEASIRDRFLELLRTTIAPAAIAHAAAGALVEGGRRVVVWGDNWRVLEGEAIESRGPIPVGAELNLVFKSADWIVLPVASDAAVQLAVDALAAGATVAARAGNVPFSEAHPCLASLAQHMHFFRSSRELANLMRLRGSPNEGRVERATMARNAILDGHTVASRLVHIADCLRRRQAGAGSH